MSAPKPLNFRAMADAWDDPIAFARELNRYYAQLAEAGAQQPPHDWTEPSKGSAVGYADGDDRASDYEGTR